MINAAAIKNALSKKMDPRRIYEMWELYGIVVTELNLDAEDLEPAAPLETGNRYEAKWRRNVRSVLMTLKNNGSITWLKYGRFHL
jgi:hypothetical protein